MVCYKPLQAYFAYDRDGKRSVKFNSVAQSRFTKGESMPDFESFQSINKDLKGNNYKGFQLPCGRCGGCRLERSRQWAVRCMNEASLYEDNCFVTLTYSEKYLPEDGSLNKKVVQDFIKRLRFEFKDRRIRFFYCGEYGEEKQRPHYHLIIFNLDFQDKYYWKTRNGYRYYRSPTLEKLWEFGNSCIGDVTFESCAYVARYCVKKITGEKAKDHYNGRLPEFCQASLKPGIGKPWIDRFGKTDVFPFDEMVVERQRVKVKSKPPRYYDKCFEKVDADAFAYMKDRRVEQALLKEDDNTFRRLAVKEKCQEARMKRLIRTMERSEL